MIRFTVYDRAFRRQGWVSSYEECTLTPRHNEVSTASFTIGHDHPMFEALDTAGSGVVVEYRGRVQFTGAVSSDVNGPNNSGLATFTVTDDSSALGGILGWQNAAGTILQQNVRERRYVSGNAETVLKTLANENLARMRALGMPLVVAPDQARGTHVSVDTRMHTLADRFFPLLDSHGIGVTILQVGTDLVLDVYTPRVVPGVLTEESGVVTQWAYSTKGPTASSLVVGGPGEGVARLYEVVDLSERVATWGGRYAREAFIDARNVEGGTEPAQRAAMRADAGQQSAESAETLTCDVTLSETSTFRYGEKVKVGDKVTVKLGSKTVTDVLREATIRDTASEGLTVSMQVGRTVTPERRVVRRVESALKGNRDLLLGR